MIVDGVELLRMIRDGEIKDGTIIQVTYYDNYRINYTFKHNCLYEGGKEIGNSVLLADHMFEILSEEDKEIDIQAIYDFDEVRDLSTWSNETLSDNQRILIKRVSQLIKSVKQLDKKIKE